MAWCGDGISGKNWGLRDADPLFRVNAQSIELSVLRPQESAASRDSRTQAVVIRFPLFVFTSPISAERMSGRKAAEARLLRGRCVMANERTS
jgi:hypothetical protein